MPTCSRTSRSAARSIVGVKADYKPFGFRDPSGGIIGIEPDLAADVAKKLGVKLELVPVVSANRMEFLNQGKIDLMIATMSDKPDRRKVVQVIEPLYYSDAVNILLKKDAPAEELGRPQGQEALRHHGRLLQQGRRPEVRTRDRLLRRLGEAAAGASRTATASATSMTRPSSPAS